MRRAISLPGEPQEQVQRKKEALAERVEKLSRVRILEAIRKKLPDALSRPDLEMVALDYFRRLGHDKRIAARYKIDSAKIGTAVREEVSESENKVKHKNKPAVQPTRSHTSK